uniref:Putative secreted protein n=1 Tax=Anopheles triannulatus TaxID=58253 RepID=A0A2M3ZY38_9DIPT
MSGRPSTIIVQVIVLQVLLLAAITDNVDGAATEEEFVAIRRRTGNGTQPLCWAIKLSPTAFVGESDCVRHYRKHQIVMIYGDVRPATHHERVRLRRKLASLRQPACRHRVPSVMMVASAAAHQSAGEDRANHFGSDLALTVRNFVASYGMLAAQGADAETCRVCHVLGVRRQLPCPAEPGTVVLYPDCRQQIERLVSRTYARQRNLLDSWRWHLRYRLQNSLFVELEQMGRLRMELLKFMATARY